MSNKNNLKRYSNGCIKAKDQPIVANKTTYQNVYTTHSRLCGSQNETEENPPYSRRTLSKILISYLAFNYFITDALLLPCISFFPSFVSHFFFFFSLFSFLIQVSCARAHALEAAWCLYKFVSVN